jgi:hypothetical protein
MKYKDGTTPSTNQYTIGNTTMPGVNMNAKMPPKNPNHLLMAMNQRINIMIPAPIHIR